jgi:hypothetical protein
MEIINLLFLSVSYYLLYGIEFYIKMLMLFIMSLIISMFSHHKYFEEKSIQPDGNTFIYFIIHSFIQSIFFIISSATVIIDKSIQVPGIKQIYLFLNEVNKHFLIGRNKIMLSFGQVLFKTFIPQLGLLGNNTPVNQEPIQREVRIENNKSTNQGKNVIFKNDKDMNNFLDGLLKEKKSN